MNYKLIFLIVPDPHADIDGALAQPLKEQQLDAVLAAPANAVESIQELIGQGREPSVVLVGPGIGNAASVARQIRTVWPVGQILFVPAGEQFEAVQTELRYVPMLGPNWSLVALDDPRLGEKLTRAVQASRQRSRLRTTLDRANVRLAAPKPVDSVAYRQSVISEHYLASLLQHSSDAIFSLGPRDNVLYWSTGAERLFQCRPRHNQPAAELPFWSAMLDALLTRIHAGASPLTAKMSTVIDAQTLHLEVSLARVQDETHTFIGTSISARDVSDVVRAIETERAGRHNAERLGRLKDEFLALLSHELRTPLSAVIGRTQLLRIQHRDAPDLQYSLNIIERNAKLQARLIEDLLDVSAIVTGKLTLELRNIAVVDLLRAATDSVQAMTDARQLKLVTQYAVGAVTIAGDVHRLQQVLYNILSNAIKFTPEGGTVHVRASLVPHSLVQIVIEDTGCGIAAEFLPYVFDKFGQEDASSTRRHGGLGIGLSIAKQLAELHAGTIAVTSPGRGLGTSFTLRFPVASAGDGTGPARQHPAAQSRMLARRRILLVEDVADTRELVKDVLSAHGAHVLTAASALIALDLLGSEALDVVVSDIGMPQMDGYQLIGEIRRRGFAGDTLPAVALTAFAGTLDRQRAFDAGFQAHVAKPYIVTELVATLTALLARQDQPVR
ncbi:hybrid sensor histidine kinase/response regulator [Massilia scottii]|uniref:hybrid sensor histidine kinase/response regulator n=1 Tax=Massilia scottii TaxID=3057166 RepID=UPI0027966CD8|nr:ATP-binding protein [Massilia sp. CCM 9029]MDQ1834073.1 ATP-binding protein [Massilia sp. CCM 9029]